MHEPHPIPSCPDSAIAAHLPQIADDLCQQQYCILDHFLPEALLHELRDLCQQREQAGLLHLAGTSKVATTNPRLRGDHIAWLEHEDTHPAIQNYWRHMHALQQQLNRTLMMGLHTFETHFAVYGPGQGYTTHIDQFQTASSHDPVAGSRLLTSILYLNPSWPADAGGALRLYLDEHSHTPAAEARALDISPAWGRLVLFLSARFWHAVLPATQSRISLTGWFKAR